MNHSAFPTSRLELLLHLPQDLNASLDPEIVLKRVMEGVIHLTGAERGFIMLLRDPISDTVSQDFNILPDQVKIHSHYGINPDQVFSQKRHISHSIVERVIREGKPVLASDAQSDERFSGQESVINLRLRSVMCAPLVSKKHILGVIYVDNRLQTGVFKPDDLELLNSVAANAAVAIDNAYLFHQAQSRFETLNALHNISKEITSTLDLQAVLTRSIMAISQLLDCEAGSILTIEGRELVFQVAVGDKSSEIKPFRLQLNQGISGWVAEHKQAVIVNDVQADPRFAATYDAQTGFLTRNMLTAPLLLNENAIGVISLINKPAGFTTEDLELVSTFASSVAFAIENARLYQVAREKGRLERELDMANRVQVSLLPAHIPQIEGWEFAARWKPARQVSGDYYDFFPIKNDSAPEETLAIIIADVADKGMPAALFMAMTRSTLRASTFNARSVAEAVTRANQLITADSPNSMYVTLCLCQLNPANGKIDYVNAGHIPPFKVDAKNEAPITMLVNSGLPLGIDDTVQFQSHSVVLNPGDMLILYTDGATDAFSPEGEPFGMDRLKEIIAANPGISATEIISVVENAVLTHMRDATPFDDFTMVAIKRH